MLVSLTKKLFHALVLIGLCALLPLRAEAADRIELEPVNLGDTTISAHFEKAKKGEWYHLYIGKTFLSGELTADEAKAGKITVDVPRGTKIVAGSRIRFEMPSFGNTFLKADYTVEGALSDNNSQTVGTKLRVTYPATVRPGEEVNAKIVLVSESGEKDVAQEAVYSYNGPIVSGSFLKGGFIVAADVETGDAINVSIMYGDERADVSMSVKGATSKPSDDEENNDLPIASGALAQDKQKVPVGDATVSLIPKEWPAHAAGAYLDLRYKSNPSAVVTMQITNLQSMVADKKIVAKLNANAKTAASFYIVFTNAEGKEVSRLPFDMQFGDSDLKDNQVRMTIGLQKIEVGSDIKAMDTAPFVHEGRTFVPLRALAEAFGAEVDYQESNHEITIKDGETEVVMRLGDKNYSVNGEKKSMDIAPYTSSAGRTIVPVRFAAEGLGYDIDVRYDAEGLTDHIIFEAK